MSLLRLFLLTIFCAWIVSGQQPEPVRVQASVGHIATVFVPSQGVVHECRVNHTSPLGDKTYLTFTNNNELKKNVSSEVHHLGNLHDCSFEIIDFKFKDLGKWSVITRAKDLANQLKNDHVDQYEIFTVQEMAPSLGSKVEAIQKESLTFELNVDHRESSDCLLCKNYNKTLRYCENNPIKAQAVGTCGFRGLASDFARDEWTIVQNSSYFITAGSFSVEVKPFSQLSAPEIHLNFYKETTAVIPLNAFDRAYCKITTAPFTNVELTTKKFTKESEYVIKEITDRSDGNWIISYFDSKDVKITEIPYIIKVEEAPPVETSVRQRGGSIVLECSARIPEFHQCSFTGPGSINVNEVTAMNYEKYDLTMVKKTSSISGSKCSLTIRNVDKSDTGPWQCSIRDDKHVLTALMKIGDEETQSGIKIFTVLNNNLNISCSSTQNWEKCNIREPSGYYVKDNKKNVDQKPCEHNIEKAQAIHTGNWSCFVTLADGTEDNKVFVVRVEEDMAYADARFEMVDNINQTILEARLFPDEDAKIAHCNWQHPRDTKKTSVLTDTTKYITEQNENVCTLRIIRAMEDDRGLYKCHMEKNIATHGDKSATAYLNLQDFPVHSDFWWYCLYGFGIFILLVIVAVLLWFNLCYQTGSKKFKNIDNKETVERRRKYGAAPYSSVRITEEPRTRISI